MKWLLKGSEFFFVTATSFFLDKRNSANSQQIALFQDQDESVYRVSGEFKFSVELAIYYHTDIRYWYLLVRLEAQAGSSNREKTQELPSAKKGGLVTQRRQTNK